MFVDNGGASQKKLFTVEQDMSEKLKTKLRAHWSNAFFKMVFLQIDEHVFSPLYCLNNGRPNFPINVLVSLEILKELLQLTDEALFERYYFDVSFRRALGIDTLYEPVCAQRTLYHFRSAVAQYERETGENLLESVFFKFRDVIIEEVGIKTEIQRTDSTLVGSNIKKLSRLMLFHKTLAMLARDMQKTGISIDSKIEAILGEDEDHFVYRMKHSEYGEAIEKIARYVYRLVSSHRGNKRICERESYKNAERLLAQQCEITKKKKVLIKDSSEVRASSMQNPADPDATYRKKNNTPHVGYAAHAVETCHEENPMQVVMDVSVVPNSVDDAAVLASKIGEYKEKHNLETMVTDGGFVSDETRARCAEHEVMLVSSAIRGRAARSDESHFTSNDFLCDEQTGEILRCPMGQRPRKVSVSGTTSVANFDPATCAKCKKRKKCPAPVSPTQSRYVIDDRRRWLDQRIKLLQTEEYQKLLRMRPPIEGLMSQLKPKYLNGRIRFRRIEKVRTRMILRAIGINFKRYWAYTLNTLSNFITQIFFPWILVPKMRLCMI